MFRRIAILTAFWLVAGAALAQDRPGMASSKRPELSMRRRCGPRRGHSDMKVTPLH
jgi:hypothetical protein